MAMERLTIGDHHQKKKGGPRVKCLSHRRVHADGEEKQIRTRP